MDRIIFRMTGRLPIILSTAALVLAPLGGYVGAQMGNGSSDPTPSVSSSPSPEPPPATLKGAYIMMPLGSKCLPGTEEAFLRLAEVGEQVTVKKPALFGADPRFENLNVERVTQAKEASVKACLVK